MPRHCRNLNYWITIKHSVMRKTIITMSVAIMSLASQAQTSYPTPQKVDVEDDYFGQKYPTLTDGWRMTHASRFGNG